MAIEDKDQNQTTEEQSGVETQDTDEESLGDEVTETQDAGDTKTSETAEKIAKAKEAGYDIVDLTPEQQARFDRVYRQVKATDRKNEALRQWNEQLQSRIEKIESSHDSRQSEDVERDLRKQLVEANQALDYEKAADLQVKLADVAAERKLASVLKKQAPQQQQPKPQVQQQDDGDDIFTPDEAAVIKSWSEQRDATGKKVRPWTDGGHELSQDAVEEMRLILTSPRYSNLTMGQKLTELDKRMGLVRKEITTSQVLPGNLTNTKKTKTIELTREQEAMADRMGVSKEAYKKQLQLMQR